MIVELSKEGAGDAGRTASRRAYGSITLTNSAATSLSYPGMWLTTNNAAATFGTDDRLFAIGPGMSQPFQWYVKFGASVVSGTRVQFRAEVFGEDVRRTRCSDSPALEFDVVLQ